MKTNAIIADAKDAVVTLTSMVRKGELVSYYVGSDVLSIAASEDIQQYHKIAVRDIKKGDAVIKYGESIGLARIDIKAGDYVHTHNLSSDGR